LVAPLVLGQTIDIDEDDWGQTEDYIECGQHIEEGPDSLRVLEGDAVAAHKAGVEKFVHLEREQSADYHQRVRMTFVLLDKLLITLVLLHDHKERQSKEEVAENIH
jgi:hypothetical protein